MLTRGDPCAAFDNLAFQIRGIDFELLDQLDLLAPRPTPAAGAAPAERGLAAAVERREAARRLLGGHPFVRQFDAGGGLLRARFCDPKIRGINKTDGLTWKVREILERAKTNVAAGLRKM